MRKNHFPPDSLYYYNDVIMLRAVNELTGTKFTYISKFRASIVIQAAVLVVALSFNYRHWGYGIHTDFYMASATVIPVGVIAFFVEKSKFSVYYSLIDAASDAIGIILIFLLGEATSLFVLANGKSSPICLVYAVFALVTLALTILSYPLLGEWNPNVEESTNKRS
jgi:hypothetical protein